jgi:MFS superfamily sulfate permease-like transporter/carbonic anhydrase
MPHALLITCSDSRVLPETLMQVDPGDLFVCRNPGNFVPLPEAPGGEAATIEYAVSGLGITDIIICGHYRCGAVKALIDSEVKIEESSSLARWLVNAQETRLTMERDFPCLFGEERWDKAVEQNVLVQLGHLAKHPVVAEGLSTGTLRLHAWVLRFETSEIMAYDACSQSFVPLLETPAVGPADRIPETCCSSPACATPEPVLPPQDTHPNWFQALKCDLPASLVVFAVALPLCVAIAKACQVPTAAGLVTAIIGGILVGCLGGGALQVSGPTAGLIVILLGIGDRVGFASLGLVVFLAGLMQLAGGFLRLGQWFRAVSPAVILGMLAGIGAVLFTQQVHVTVDDAPARSALTNLVGIPRAIWDICDGHDGHLGHLPAALIGLSTLAILLLWKPFCPKRLKSIPGLLVAVVAATAGATIFDLPIQRVEFDSLVQGITLLDFSAVPMLLRDGVVWQLALMVAIVASAETLLTAAAVDQMHIGRRTGYDRELAAQGLGNALCGLLGALPMASVIVRSSANVQAGAKSRLSAVLHGVWMLAFVMLFPALLRLVPTATLAATLVLTGIKLIQFKAIRELWKESRAEGMICIAVAFTVISWDLLVGVAVGIALSAAKLLYAFTRLRIRHRIDAANRRSTLVLEGSATFLRLPKLASTLEMLPPGIEVHVDLKGLSYIDHACLTLLVNWEKQHQATGGKLSLDWDTLRSRFNQTRPRPRVENTRQVSIGARAG